MKLDFGFVLNGAIFANSQAVWIWSGLSEVGRHIHQAPIHLYPFFSKEEQSFYFSNCQKMTHAEFEGWLLEQKKNVSTSLAKSWTLPQFEIFKQQIEGIHILIKEQKIQKAVACDFAQTQTPIDPGQILVYLSHLLVTVQKNPLLWGYGCWTSAGGVLGVSPELLFYRDQLKLRTMAVAGTQAILSVKQVSLLDDPKERGEHQAVIDDIHQQLTDWGELNWEDTKVVEYPQLRHLKTELTCTLYDSIDTAQLIKQLHPTAALGVYPRDFGITFLQQWQDPQLKAYHGGVMHVNLPEQGEFALVMIRNIQWNQSQQWVAVGMGVVEASQPANEWQEWQIKFDMIKKSLLGDLP